MSDNDAESFQEESNKPVQVDLKERFYEILKRKGDVELSDTDNRALFYRALFLNDKERIKFKRYLVLENMTEEEEARYRRLLPHHIFVKYFPNKTKEN